MMKTRIKNCPDCKDGVCKRCKGTGKLKIINSRSKGNSFERQVAKILSTWTGLNFKRTPLSGGWAKTGDITPISPVDMVSFIFNVEIKKYKHWDFNQVLKTKFTGLVFNWWSQCLNDSIKSNKIPILIMGRDNDAIYTMLFTKHFDQIFINNPDVFKISFNNLSVFILDDLLKLDYNNIIAIN